MYCSIPLEYTIRCDVIVIATVVDVVVLKECKRLVEHVVTYDVAYVVGYFVLNFVDVFVGVVCKYSCNICL